MLVCILTILSGVWQAAERAIGELTRLQKPLETEADVMELTMGAKSKDKVLEIMQTGTLRSIEMLAKDEQQQVIQLVSFGSDTWPAC